MNLPALLGELLLAAQLSATNVVNELYGQWCVDVT